MAFLLVPKEANTRNSVLCTPYAEQLFTFVSEANAPYTELSPVKAADGGKN